MRLPRPSRLDATFAILIGLALASLAATRLVPGVLIVNGIVFGLAILKGRKVALDFLGLRDAPPLWRGLVGGWIVLVAGTAWASAAAALLR